MEFEKAKIMFEEQIPQILAENPHWVGNGDTDGGCYTASKLAHDIFEGFEIPCEILFVRGVIENEKAKEIRHRVGMDDPLRLKQILIEEGGYAMGIGLGNDPNGMPNFHSILWFPEQKEILDMTIRQLSRPQYDIIMPEYFFGDASEYLGLFSDDYDDALPELMSIRDFNKFFYPASERHPEEFEQLKATVVELMGLD